MANPYVKQTWTDNVSQTTAARMGTMEQGIFDAHIQPAARVTHTVAQSITTSGTPQTLAFDTERHDQDGLGTSTMHDNATNNSRLTCKVAGIYAITANVEWASNATGVRAVNLQLNGATTIAAEQCGAVSGANIRQSVNCDYSLAVNDYVEVVVLQTSGGALNVAKSAQYSPEFSMHRVG